MKKILFIGNFNQTFEDVEKELSARYQVQLSTDELNTVRGMLRMNPPDAVLISLQDMDHDTKILSDLYNRDFPVVVYGSDFERRKFSVLRTNNNFHVVNRPFKIQELIDAIELALKEGETKAKSADSTIGNEVTLTPKTEATSDLKQAQKSEPKPEPKPAPKPASKPEAPRKKNILVIDDSPEQLKVISGMLQEMYDVRLATGAMKAMTLIGKRKPDAILLDYEMPEIDGRRTFEMIKEMEDTQDIPVIFLTGIHDAENVRAVVSLKPAAYLLKPASKVAIIETLNKVIK